MIRVALISPKGPLYRHTGGIWRKSLRYMPLTLPTLAALIPSDLDISLSCFDEGIDDIDTDMIVDLVGMTVITGTATRAYELAAIFKARGVSVVLGGPHVTLAPEDAQPHADAIVTGYAEDTWPELLRDYAAGRMRKRYDQATSLSLANRPFAKRDVLPSARFLTNNVFEATRGCVHDCDFCVVPSAWGTRPYQKPVDEVVEDIRRHRARRLIFVDLNIIADRPHAARLFEALIPLRVEWFGLATTLIGKDPELLSLAARSGCRGLLIGFESLCSASLRDTRKGFNNPAYYREVISALHKHKIAIQGCFVFGADHDTPEVFQQTAEFAVQLKIDLPRFAILTPFPGTGLYRRFEAEGRILSRDWSLYDAQHAVYQPSHMSPRELHLGTERAWKYAYSFRNIARRLSSSPAPLGVALGTNIGYRYYAHRLKKFYTCDWPEMTARNSAA